MVMQPVMWQEEECRSGIVAHGRKMDCEQLLISSATSCACTAQVRDTWRPHLTHVTLVLMSHVHSRSRLDIDFTRLLSRCDRDAAVSSSPLSASGWRLERFIESLEDKLAELCKLTTCQPDKDRLSRYRRKIRFLKGLVEAEKMRSASERLVAAQILSPGSSGNQKNDRSKQVLLQTQSKYAADVRDELMPAASRRKAAETADDADIVLHFHRQMQEKVAMEMVSLAHNLKQNLNTAAQILRKDVQVLSGAARHADANISGLRQNSDRLTDFVRRSCHYWLWISLAVVCFAFLWIVVFIRMFPKRV